MSYEGPVRMTTELERVLALPRRKLDFQSPEVEALRWSWSPMLLNDYGRQQFEWICKLPPSDRDAQFVRWGLRRNMGGENCPLLLSGEQAVSLYEAYHQKGAFIGAGVGFGKTLISWLLTLIFGAERALLLVTGGLVDKTHSDFRDIARCWKAPVRLPEVLSFEKLGQPDGDLLLCNCPKCTRQQFEIQAGIRPTHIFADESDKLRNPKAAVTRRVGRYMSRHSDTVYVGMTGTPWRKSITNAAPQLIWALKWGAPVPLSYVDTQTWSEALDLSSRAAPRDPGALCWLNNVDPNTIPTYQQRVDIAAEGFKNRLLETPGVIQTRGQSCKEPIYIRVLKAPEDPLLNHAFQVFRETNKTLDGWDVSDPLTGRKHACEMSAGFYYVWNPRPPKDWLDARAAASAFIRKAIEESGRRGRPLDSQAPVYQAFPNEPVLLRWLEIEPTFPIVVEPRPITMSVLAYAAAWAQQNGPGLIWVQHDYVGKTLSALTGIPYFGSKGKDPSGRYIEHYPPDKSAIVSLQSNERGRNLQAWYKNLVIAPHESATKWEQAVLGRTHRQGQIRPVYCDILISCAENLRAVEKALEEVEWGESRAGTEQKLGIAEIDWSHFPREALQALPDNDPSYPRWNVAA